MERERTAPVSTSLYQPLEAILKPALLGASQASRDPCVTLDVGLVTGGTYNILSIIIKMPPRWRAKHENARESRARVQAYTRCNTVTARGT